MIRTVGIDYDQESKSWQVYDRDTDLTVAVGIASATLARIVANLYRLQAEEVVAYTAEISDADMLGLIEEGKTAEDWVAKEVDGVFRNHVRVQWPAWYQPKHTA